MRTPVFAACLLVALNCAPRVETADRETEIATTVRDTEATAAPHVDIPTVPLKEVDVPPRYLSGPAPDYTLEMIQNKVQGVVTARALVARSGVVKDVVILEDLGHGTDKATRDALMKYTFEPATKGGRTVAVWIEMSVNFGPSQR
jgi:outer membrane biosynthesis protein TonB